MKRKSFIAIFAAMALLSGCAAENVKTVDIPESVPAASTGGESTVTKSSADPEINSVAAESSASTGKTTPVPPVVEPVEPSAPTDAYVAVSDGDHGASSASSVAEPITTTVAKPPAATTVPTVTEAHSDPSGDEYKPTDIGGTGKSYAEESKSGADDGGFIYDAAEDIAVDGIVADVAVGGAIEPECCPVPEPWEEPIEPIEPQIPPQAGLLTGGEWRDNDNWEFWQSLYGSANYSVDWEGYRDTWRTGADFRLEVTVKDSTGELIEGAKVTTDQPKYSAVTDNNGRAYLFYSQEQVINGFTELTVSFGDITATEQLTLGSDDSVEITLDSAAQKPEKTLDLMIMCDTTGSMWDELDYLKEELEDVVTRIKTENANIPTRLSVNFYRDEGDEYVVREFPFTTDLGAAVNAISEQSADGGGDTPEAVHTALESAINSHDWDENSVKIMFLVLDAPPHSDIQIIDQTVKLVKQAAEKGIRIIPVASSGIDKSTEYLLRSMAFMTGGTYTFLTNDSGIGGDHIEPTIGSYDVEKLNDMMVRIVGDYLD